MATVVYKNLRLAKDRLKVLLNQAQRRVKFGDSRYGANRKRSTEFFTKTEAKARLNTLMRVKKVLDTAPQFNKWSGVTKTSRIKVSSSLAKQITRVNKGQIIKKYQDLVTSRKVTASNASSQRTKALAAATNFSKRKNVTSKDVARLKKFYNKTAAPRKNRLGFIYKITDTKTKRVYIGQTVKSVNARFLEHKNERGTPLDNALTKSNVGRFKVQTIAKTTSRAKLDRLEAKYIQKFKTLDPKKGFNVRAGTRGTAALTKYRTNSFKKFRNTKIRIIKRKS